MTHQDLVKRNIRNAMNKSEEFSHNCIDGTHKIKYTYMNSSTVVTFEKGEYHVGDFSTPDYDEMF
ncbi:hypothetical protein, partial [Luteibacter rhizovicinus]